MSERVVPAVRDAAERLLVDLAADEKFVAHVAKAEIERRVAAGELVPISRLQLGGGLELTPMGRVAALEGAISSALALLDAELPNMADAVRAVLTHAHPANATPDPSTPTKLATPKPISGSPEPAEVVDPTPPAKEVPDDGRPAGMVAPGGEAKCDWCQVAIDSEQANLGMVRFRTLLCKKHYLEYPSRKTGKPAA